MVEYNQRIRHAPGLFFAVGAGQINGQRFYATGVAETAAEAQARRNSELAEASAIWLEKHECRNHYNATSGLTRGTAAAYSEKVSISRASQEAVERLLVLDWWFEGGIALTPASEMMAQFHLYKAELNRHKSRPAFLIELTSVGGPPTFAAWSSRSDGLEIVLGAACRSNPSCAVRAALREMIQMECGLEIIRFREAAGVRLNKSEIRILDRARNLRRSDCDTLFSTSEGSKTSGDNFQESPKEYLEKNGLTMYTKMLPRPDSMHYVASVTIEKDQPRASAWRKTEKNIGKPWRSVQPY